MSITLKRKGDFKLDKSVKEYSRFKKRIPNILATTTVNHFKKGFSKGGKQTNDSKSGWKPRKKVWSKKEKGSRNILVKTGTLQRDIQKKQATFKSIKVGTGNITSDYAEIHNKGGVINHPGGTNYGFRTKRDASAGKISFLKSGKGYLVLGKTKAHRIPIPKREFIGDSDSLDKKNLVSLRKGLDKVFEV